MRDRYPGAAVGRPAPARRRRARARGGPAADADGRAVRRDRPDQPRAAPEPVPAAPVGDPQDDPVRHPRHRRGDQDGRPGGGAAEGRRAGPVRDAGGAADEPGERLRRGLRRRRPGAEAPVAAARARHRPLEGAARARRRADRRGARARSPRRTCRTRSWSTRRAGPLGWMSERDLARRDGAGQARHRARTRSSSSTTCCATRSRTCSSPTPSTGRWWTSAGAWSGVLSVEIISALPELARGDGAARPTRPSASTPDADARLGRARARRRSRSATAAATAASRRTSFCPGWIVDNFDRYTDPLARAHLYLTVASVAIGFVIAFALALLARRRRWLVGPIVGLTGVLYTLPSLARLLPAAADHRPRHDDGGDRAHRLHAADHLPQHRHRASTTCPADAQRRRPRHGPHRPPAAVAGGAAAGAARHHRRPADRHHEHGRARDAGRVRRRRRPRRADRHRQQHHVQDGRGRGRRAGGAAGARARRGAARACSAC